MPPGHDQSEGRSDSHSDIEMDTEGGFSATTDVRGTSLATTIGLAVHPTDTFEEANYQIEDLDTQQHRFTSRMTAQPPQHQVSAVRKETPVFFRVADVPDPELTQGQIEYLDARLARRNRELYSSPAEIEAAIAARQQRLVSFAVVVDDSRAAMELPAADTQSLDHVDSAASLENRRAARRRKKS